MSTLSEHTGNGSPTATSLQREDTKEQIDGVLQHFDVLPSGFDQFIFRYVYIYLIGLFFLGYLFLIPPILPQPQAGKFLSVYGVSALPVVVLISMIWLFNVWRLRTPKTLRDLVEKERIEIRDGDTNKLYLRFLEYYRERPPHNILYVDGHPNLASRPPFPCKLLGKEVRLMSFDE